MESTLHVVATDRDWACASWGSVFILVWRGETSLTRTRAGAGALTRFAGGRSRGVGILVVLEDSVRPPESDARAALAGGLRENGAKIRGLAYVVPQQGFKGAVLRGVITGLSLVGREPFPTRCFVDVESAARWLGERLASAVDERHTDAQIAAAVRDARAL